MPSSSRLVVRVKVGCKGQVLPCNNAYSSTWCDFDHEIPLRTAVRKAPLVKFLRSPARPELGIRLFTAEAPRSLSRRTDTP